jgi:uncharacterized protein
MHSALYTGSVSHRRRAPRRHLFRYPLFMVWLDLAELGEAFRGRWLWGVERRALAAFWRADHMGDPRLPLDRCVRDLVARATGRTPAGPIRLLTHLRYFGYCFNPVSFYYCYDQAGRAVETIVAEVNNTPWGERHCYVLGAEAARAAAVPGTDATPVRRWLSDKQLHVSPFMPMDLQYEWQLSEPAAVLRVHMRCLRSAQPLLDATLTLRRRPLGGAALAATLLRFPWMTLRVISAIHWQALRLWLKRVPYHPHPALQARSDGRVSPRRAQ